MDRLSGLGSRLHGRRLPRLVLAVLILAVTLTVCDAGQFWLDSCHYAQDRHCASETSGADLCEAIQAVVPSHHAAVFLPQPLMTAFAALLPVQPLVEARAVDPPALPPRTCLRAGASSLRGPPV